MSFPEPERTRRGDEILALKYSACINLWNNIYFDSPFLWPFCPIAAYCDSIYSGNENGALICTWNVFAP